MSLSSTVKQGQRVFFFSTVLASHGFHGNSKKTLRVLLVRLIAKKRYFW